MHIFIPSLYPIIFTVAKMPRDKDCFMNGFFFGSWHFNFIDNLVDNPPAALLCWLVRALADLPTDNGVACCVPIVLFLIFPFHARCSTSMYPACNS